MSMKVSKSNADISEPFSEKRKLARLLMLGVFFACSFRDLRFISFLSPQDVLLFAALLSLYFGSLESYKRKKLILSQIVSFFLFLIFSFESQLSSANPRESITNYLKIYVAFVLLPSAIWIFVNKMEDVTLLFWGYLSGALLSSISTIFLHLGGPSGSRSSGLSGHPVFFGSLTASAIVVTLSINHRTIRTKVFSLILVIFFALGLFLSASSTGLIIILIGLIVIVLMNLFDQKLLRTILSLITFYFIGFFIWNANFFSNTKTRFLLSLNPQTGYSTNRISGTSTFEARLYSIKYAWKRIQDSPVIGHGLDTQGRITSIGLEPHNFIILSWQTGGVLLLALSMFFLYVSVRYFVLAINLKFRLGIVVILITWLQLMTQPIIYERSVLAPLFLVIAALNTEKLNKKNLKAFPKPAPPP